VALNASGPISLGGSTAGESINLELGQSATAQVSLNDTNVRSLAGVPSGAIIMPTNFYGKSTMSVSANSVSGSASGFASSGFVATSGTPNTTVTGGTSPFTFSWVRISGSTVPQISSATAQNPGWSNANTPEGINTATWRVTVTDANSNTATADITVTLQWINLN
jgi:hypothetical protein